MSTYSAIADVGASIMGVLLREMVADDATKNFIGTAENLSLLSPADPQTGTEVHLSVYLYRIAEDPYTRNQYPVAGNGGSVRKAPLTLDLYYMLTPLGLAPDYEQVMLGKAMQVLYDNPSLSGPDLLGSLAGGDPVRIVLNPVTLEETTRIWQALETPFRLSVCYVARVAIITSTRESFTQPVLQRKANFREPVAPQTSGVLS